MASPESGVRVVLSTAPDAEVGGRLAQALVGEGLAACVNLVAGVRSIYRWQGRVQDDAEVLLVIKTTEDRLPALCARVRALHPYELPELLALPAVGGSADYLAWVAEEVAAVSLAHELERAAEALPELADAIRPANGDPERLLRALEAGQAARVLGWLLAEAPDEAGGLAAEWAEHEVGVAALAAVQEAGLPKAGQKELRRVRHRLRSRGFELPEAPPAPRVATLPGVEADLEGAFVSPLDPGGSRAVVLVVSHPSGGARIFELVTDELLGIRRCEVYQASRGKARRFLKDATEGSGRTGVAVEPASARALLGRIAEGQPADRSLPRPFAEWRSQLTAAPAGTPTPGEQAAAALGEPDPAAAERLREMVARGLVGPWPPPEASLRGALAQLAEVRESRILLSGGARRQRLEEILGDAVERAFDARFSGRTAARFEESAYVFWKTGHEDEARACLAGARAFRSSGEGGEVRSNPVARALLERLLAPLLQEKQEEKQEQESGSLLVKP